MVSRQGLSLLAARGVLEVKWLWIEKAKLMPFIPLPQIRCLSGQTYALPYESNPIFDVCQQESLG